MMSTMMQAARIAAVTPNDKEAFQWYLKAANQGDAKAQFKVAQAYQSGTGIAQDQLQAQQWLQKAAQAKHPLAQATLAKL